MLFFLLLADRANDDGAGDCCEPACRRVGGDSGVRDHPTAAVRPWTHRHEESGQQLLPQLCHASALHCPGLREQVSTRISWHKQNSFTLFHLIIDFVHPQKQQQYQTVRVSSEPLPPFQEQIF